MVKGFLLLNIIAYNGSPFPGSQEVRGSNPLISTKYLNKLSVKFTGSFFIKTNKELK